MPSMKIVQLMENGVHHGEMLHAQRDLTERILFFEVLLKTFLMAGNFENFAFGAFETGSSSGVRKDKRPIAPVTSLVLGQLGQFEVMSSSVDGGSSKNHSRLVCFGELPHVSGVPKIQSGSGSSHTAISYGPSAGGITQNLIDSINFETRTSCSPSIAEVNQNLLGLVSCNIGSSSGSQITRAPENFIVSPDHNIGGISGNYFWSNGSGIESSFGRYISESSVGLSGSTVGSSSSPHINPTYVRLSASEPVSNTFCGSIGSENGSSFINCQNYFASANCEIYYGQGSLQIRPSFAMQQNQYTNSFNIGDTSENNSELHSFRISSLTTQQNNVPIINGSHGIHFELGSNQPNSFSVRGQNMRSRRGRPHTHYGLNRGGVGSSTQGRPQPRFGLNRDGAASSARGRQSTRFNQDLRTSINHSSSSQVVAESRSSRQPIRAAEHFGGEKRLHSKMAEREDWTKNEIAIVEQAIKIPCTLTRPTWLSWISGFLRTKTALDVAVFLKYFMIERNSKRIKVDLNVTSTGNNRQENMFDPSPSSSRLAGSFGPHVQNSTSSSQAMGGETGQLLQPASAVFPLPVITEETTNAAPLDFRTNEELVNSVSSPTFDLDLSDLPFSPRGILEDLAHLSFPPEPSEPENPDRPSGSWS